MTVNCFKCGAEIPDTKYQQSLWELSGMCDKCRQEAQGIDEVGEEEKAWNKLKETFPCRYITLQMEYVRYADGLEGKNYNAYIDGTWGEICPDPMKAVDSAIELEGKKNV